MGEKSLCHFATTTLSKKSDLRLDVKSIDISHYPKVNIVILVEKKQNLHYLALLTLMHLIWTIHSQVTV